MNPPGGITRPARFSVDVQPQLVMDLTIRSGWSPTFHIFAVPLPIVWGGTMPKFRLAGSNSTGGHPRLFFAAWERGACARLLALTLVYGWTFRTAGEGVDAEAPWPDVESSPQPARSDAQTVITSAIRPTIVVRRIRNRLKHRLSCIMGLSQPQVSAAGSLIRLSSATCFVSPLG